MRRLGRVLGFTALALTAGQVIACSVDGVTPDCSNPAVCAPSSGDAATSGDANLDVNVVRDTGSVFDAGSEDALASDATDATTDGG